MLRLDDKIISAKDLAIKFNVPLHKLKESKRFEINPILKGFDLGMTKHTGKRVSRVPSGINRPAVFEYKDEDGMDHEIRYSDGAPTKRKTKDSVIEVYSPRNFRVEGEGTLAKNLDLSLFMYLHYSCRQSPLRPDNYQWVYEYHDEVEKAQGVIDGVSILKEAINHPDTLKDQELILFAKGMGVHNASVISEVEVRSKLSEMAMKDPKEYMKHVKKGETMIDGRIQDAIDLGVFVVARDLGYRRWIWGKGAHEGSEIVGLLDPNTPEDKVLKSHLKQNINKYYDQLMAAHGSASASVSVEQFLASRKVEEPKKDPSKEKVRLPLPGNFNEAKIYLKEAHPEGKQPAPKIIAQLVNDITDGIITDDNIDFERHKYMAKV